MKQPEALRLADDLIDLWDSEFFEREDVEQAAAELRRLHNEVTDLKQALDIADAVFKERDRLHEADEHNRKYVETLEKEVKRLHEANQAMLEALQWIDQYYRIERNVNHMVAEQARAAIAKGEQHEDRN